jgi:hypothetical protein
MFDSLLLVSMESSMKESMRPAHPPFGQGVYFLGEDLYGRLDGNSFHQLRKDLALCHSYRHAGESACGPQHMNMGAQPGAAAVHDL